ncbi:MAG: tryptophan-rich sensory protein [Clostridia bacterium]|nr:tryptophan-rich sensory protein [Clostridia bacterium]
MKIKWKNLIICILIPLAVGALSAFITKDSMSMFEEINKPPLSPSPILFPIVWTILYILMGISSYLVYTSDAAKYKISSALQTYAIQLAVNFFWSIIFFNMQLYLLAFVWLILLWILIISTIIKFNPISKTAAYLLIPYLLWVTFAGYLNIGIYFLN